MVEVLSQEQIEAELAGRLHEWGQVAQTLVRSVTVATFPQGIDLVRRVADVAERRNHHPDIDIRWTTITFRLSTHTVGGITAADVGLATEIDAIVEELAGERNQAG